MLTHRTFKYSTTAIVFLLLFGCSSSSTNNPTSSNNEPISSQPPEPTPTVQDSSVVEAEEQAHQGAEPASNEALEEVVMVPRDPRARPKNTNETKSPASGGMQGFIGERGRKSRDRLLGEKKFDDDRAFIDEPIIGRHADPSMVFKNYGVNPTVETREQDTTTFSTDTDTASYYLAKAFLDKNTMPDPDGIRVEDFVNAFDYNYLASEHETFALHAEAFPSPFRRGFHVLHLGVKAKEIEQVGAKPANLTFLIDVSGSMARGGRLETVKSALRTLVKELHPNDTITIVAYTTTARLILEATEVRHSGRIIRAIKKLKPEDNTNIEAGIELAYRMANKSYDPDKINRIILCSDGVANAGTTDPDEMLLRISKAARKGIYLTTVGVGMGNYNDVILETLAKTGEGQYAYINSREEAEHLFVDNLAATLQVIARDTKIQVEFDPSQVARYRLLGYENRKMANADFKNANKDAAEIGVGHQVTAIYEVKFRHPPRSTFGSFRISYKQTEGERLYVIERDLPASIIEPDPDSSTYSAQLSYIAAAFAEKLRESYWSRSYDYQALSSWLKQVHRHAPNPVQAQELNTMIATADRIDRRQDRYDEHISITKMGFDHVPVLR